MINTNKPNININFIVDQDKNRSDEFFQFFTNIFALNKLKTTFTDIFHYKTVIDKRDSSNEQTNIRLAKN